MLAVGLTGGIGSGKSTVADLLVDRGAVLIDADQIARDVVAPGEPAYRALVERFGGHVVSPDGSIDRKALAALAFSDSASLEALNSITHPAIGARMSELRQAQKDSDHVVILDIPLLKPVHRELLDLDTVVVVDAPVDMAVERLVSKRGFDRDDAEARVAAQPSRDERLAGADFHIDNSSDRGSLLAQVESLWRELLRLERLKRNVGTPTRGEGDPATDS